MNLSTTIDASQAADGRTAVSTLLRGRQTPIERRTGALQQYLRVFAKRKLLIFGAIAAAVVLGLLATLLATPQYTATTQIEISRNSDRIVGVEEVKQETQIQDQEFYQTQYGLLRSYSLAEKVVRDLKLQDDEDFFVLMDAAPEDEQALGARERNERIRMATLLLLQHISIDPLRGSSLVDISFTSPSAEFSAKVANSWAKNFIESNLARRFEATAYAREFLESRLAQLRARLEQSERDSVNYAAQQGLVSVASPSQDGSDNASPRLLVADDLSRLNAELAEATGARIEAESRMRSQSGAASNEALASATLTSLRQRRAEAAGEYARLMAQFEPGYPPAQALQAQIANLDSAISREEGRINQTLANNYRASVSRENALRTRVEDLKSQLVSQQNRGIQYNIYEREADTNRQLYDALLQRYKEIGIAGGVGTNNVAIVDQAEIPRAPSSPNLLLNMALALMLGSLIGFGGALALEQIDEVISDAADAEAILNVPTLGTVPKTEEGSQEQAFDPKSSLTEAYVAVQAALQFSTTHGFPRSLVVTSTRPGEGKSTTALALALAQARRGTSAILIDCDMRSPSVHHLLSRKNDVGVSNYLVGNDDAEQLIKRNAAPGLDAIFAGPQPPNAGDLLATSRLSHLIEELGKHYACVIVDAPPVMGLADAPLIASAAEGAVFVVEAHKTPVSLIRMALQRLSGTSANLLGVALTKFQTEKSNYGYGYDYGYSYNERQQS